MKEYTVNNQPKRAIELYNYFLDQKIEEEVSDAYDAVLTMLGIKVKAKPENPKPKTKEFAYCTQKEYEEFLSVKEDIYKLFCTGKITRLNYKSMLEPLEDKHYYDALMNWLQEVV